MITIQEKVKLSWFNNLTKILSFNLYDFAIAMTDEQRQGYITYIDERYSAERIRDIAREVCAIIEANILTECVQDYEPCGASTMTLMSDVKGGKWEPAPGAAVAMHLDKSHITTHTYPDASSPDGICTFRVDIDVATCGEIIPLKALELMFNAFESDVVFIDYVVRGYTRLESGKKIYNDQPLASIQEYIPREILDRYVYRQDVNLAHDNIWQTKLMVGNIRAESYLLDPRDLTHPDLHRKMQVLTTEMREVFHLT